MLADTVGREAAESVVIHRSPTAVHRRGRDSARGTA